MRENCSHVTRCNSVELTFLLGSRRKKTVEKHGTVSLLPTTAPPSASKLKMALRRLAHLSNFLALSTITFYYQSILSLQDFDKFRIKTRTLFQCNWRDTSKKHNMSSRQIRKLVILLKGNNIQSFPFLIWSQDWQLAGMSTRCSMESLYTWVF